MPSIWGSMSVFHIQHKVLLLLKYMKNWALKDKVRDFYFKMLPHGESLWLTNQSKTIFSSRV
jgi:hypothetical protein